MHVLSFIAGLACLFVGLLDAFQTVILPRRATGHFRLTGLVYVLTWRPWTTAARLARTPRKRETMLSFYGPLSLVLLLVMWAASIVVGFALLYYGLGSPFADPLMHTPGWHSDLYVSGTTLFTLGLGDMVPHTHTARYLMVLESGMGLGFVAVVIGYFPVLYGAFSRREVSISLLDARAGSPPTAAELMRRHAFDGGNDALILLLEEWERWSAELLESHISYPLLCYFRSQHTNQSWLAALTAVLDACALLVSGVQEYPARQAQLTFAMARHALVDLSQIFSLTPVPLERDRLPQEGFVALYDQLCQAGVRVCRDADSLARLRKMRQLYEGHAEALSRYLLMPLPPFVAEQPHKDNWMTVARLRAETEAVNLGEASATGAHAIMAHDEEDHLF
ncbi:potassium channel family protein [Acidipila rosea]|uniref:Ion channel n=1 Tax=Acidipila rosea TaxID=768535 RepID=A0A4R1L7U7_9BACT|nr:potassium channel family protein [Acidipila rosea]TCK74306.1 ion channel [Acidipila rosea]